jgi:hypothetical protein
MTVRIVPRTIDGERIEIWAGTLDPLDAGKPITINLGPSVLALNPLKQIVAANVPAVSRTTITYAAQGLRHDTTYQLSARIGSDPEVPCGSIRTLPSTLGTRSNPLRVMLVSCFSRLAQDASVAPGLLNFILSKESLRPHIKIWCGDQVYLDSPASHHIFNTHSEAELTRRHVDHYAATWFATKGMSQCMSEGANLFCPDDHELWNNAPFPTAIARDTWLSDKRELWRKIARNLYLGFQNPDTRPQTFSMGPLSFCITDMRMDRDAERKHLMTQPHMDLVKAWIASLTGPGVLVLGQVLFAKAAGFFKGKFGDYALQNYAQFAELGAAMHASRHSIVVLTGDVHYSRVATTRLPSGATLAEVICSPFALVKGAKGSWEPAPTRMRLENGASLGGAIETDGNIRSADQNVALLSFFTAGSRIGLGVELWPTRPKQGAYAASQATEILL